MADAYGVIVFHKSSNFSGDLSKICKELNELGEPGSSWDFGGCAFQEREETLVFAGRSSVLVQYPTVFPERVAYYELEEGDQSVRLTPAEVSGDQSLSDLEDFAIMEQVPLADICEKLSKHIDGGHILLAATANERLCYNYCEELQVEADGSGRRFRWRLHYLDGQAKYDERHLPNTGASNAA